MRFHITDTFSNSHSISKSLFLSLSQTHRRTPTHTHCLFALSAVPGETGLTFETQVLQRGREQGGLLCFLPPTCQEISFLCGLSLPNILSLFYIMPFDFRPTICKNKFCDYLTVSFEVTTVVQVNPTTLI